ncbi:NUDE protein, C-terminal conserved region domain containing protein [Elaphomyces granulatus]
MPMANGHPSALTSVDEELAYYKSQYEQLELELADFQSSSRELETELEKDIEAYEKRERQLKEKVESLGYEVEEWKTKYKQAKAEANSVQGTLQKEITLLRENSRSLQLKLRDIEVANDDYERQARNTTSSLEDLESKYNVSIERGVLLEEEIRNGEQEREALRIEAQRLRDELSDLKIEADIVQEKLRKSETDSTLRRMPGPFHTGLSVSRPPDGSDRSSATSTSSPTATTPPAKSVSSATSEAVTPPSPAASESSTSIRNRKPEAVSGIARPRLSITDSNATPRSVRGGKSRQHTRTPSIPYSNGYSTPSLSSRQSVSRLDVSQSSGSLYQIRGLIGKMQKLEERVQSAKSRHAPDRRSPRTPSALGQSAIPSSVTMRKGSRKRASGSSVSSSALDGDTAHSFIPHSRQSFGTRTQGDSRPSSRTSLSSRSSISHNAHAGGTPQPRPESRQSLNRTRTPLGHYSTTPTAESRRPRSSLSSYAGLSHTPSSSMSYIDEDSDITTPTPRRSTIGRDDSSRSSIPTPAALKKRPSGIGSGIPAPRKISSGLDRQESERGPPDRKKKLSDLGETY